MEELTSLLAFTAGMFVRLALPIALTALLILFLRKLDARWQEEASRPRVDVPKIECWRVMGCSPEQRKNCTAASSSLPCWQVYRLPNGYLSNKCLSCRVFLEAPMPMLKTEPRRL
jgi:hypothetical protein